jgi:hypothetical protein
MKIRELLQTEIWSKRTSRKILVVTGIVLGILALGIGSLYEVNERWLTPREKSLAKAAFAQIDALQDVASFSDEDFDAKSKDAEAKVKAAQQAAMTVRDEQIAFVLDGYRGEIEDERDNIKMQKLMQERHVPIKSSGRSFEETLNTQVEVAKFLRSVLHRTLD